jgi:hypothetical protein
LADWDFSKDGSVACFGKVGEWSGLKPLEKPSATPKLIKITPPKPTTPVRDGVIEEPLRAPPQKQVWVPKPKPLRNTLDTLPEISSYPLRRSPQSFNRIASPTKKSTKERGDVTLWVLWEGWAFGWFFSLGGREMSGRFLSQTERTWTTLLMVFMILLFRDIMRGLDVLCLLLLGLRQWDHVVFVPDGVLVKCHMAKDPVAVALVLTSAADHNFLLMVIASLLNRDMWCFS